MLLLYTANPLIQHQKLGTECRIQQNRPTITPEGGGGHGQSLLADLSRPGQGRRMSVGTAGAPGTEEEWARAALVCRAISLADLAEMLTGAK